MRSHPHRAPLAAAPLVALGALIALLAAPPASATPDTLKRSVENILLAPLDLALSPIVAGKTIYDNLLTVDDSLGVKIAYPVPGFFWTVGVQAGAAVIREVAGLLELLPGIGLAFTDADITPIFTPVERSEALVDYETPVLHFRFGINYTTGNY